MIETRFETPFGTGHVLIYNNRSARFWAGRGSNSTLVINGVEFTVDFQIGRKDDGTWDLGYYEEPHYTNAQNRSWRRGFPDVKRADWIHSGKTPSNSARDKVREQLVPAFIKFIQTQTKLLADAECQERIGKAAKLEAQIEEKREELEQLVRQHESAVEQVRLVKCAG